MQIQHEGGRRLNEGSWEHHLILKWVQDQAPARKETPDRLVRLDVTPSEIVFSSGGNDIGNNGRWLCRLWRLVGWDE